MKLKMSRDAAVKRSCICKSLISEYGLEHTCADCLKIWAWLGGAPQGVIVYQNQDYFKGLQSWSIYIARHLKSLAARETLKGICAPTGSSSNCPVYNGIQMHFSRIKEISMCLRHSQGFLAFWTPKAIRDFGSSPLTFGVEIRVWDSILSSKVIFISYTHWNPSNLKIQLQLQGPASHSTLAQTWIVHLGYTDNNVVKLQTLHSSFKC